MSAESRKIYSKIDETKKGIQAVKNGYDDLEVRLTR